MKLPFHGSWNFDRATKTLRSPTDAEVKRGYLDARGTDIHRAVDIQGPTGTNIYAVQDGVTRRVDDTYPWSSGYGRYLGVTGVDDRGYIYAHLSNLDNDNDALGNLVIEDEFLGDMGSTGRSDGPHLHFEVLWTPWDRSTTIDPWPLLVWLTERDHLNIKEHKNPYPFPANLDDNRIRAGERSFRVAWLQWALKFARITCIADTRTVEAFQAFQKSKFGRTYASVGPNTAEALRGRVRTRYFS